MSSLSKEQKQLALMVQEEGNKICADCSAKNPSWASFNLGMFMCIDCSGIHRSLGTHITKVKSINLDSWKAEWVNVMRQMGNIKANHIWEGRMTDAERARKPRPDATMAAREKFIRDKYERCLYKVDAATAAAIAAGSMAAPVSAPVASSPAPHAVAPPAAVHHSEPGVSFGHSSLVGRQGRRRSSSGNVLDHHVTHGPAHTSAASTNPAVLRRLAKKLGHELPVEGSLHEPVDTDLLGMPVEHSPLPLPPAAAVAAPVYVSASVAAPQTENVVSFGKSALDSAKKKAAGASPSSAHAVAGAASTNPAVLRRLAKKSGVVLDGSDLDAAPAANDEPAVSGIAVSPIRLAHVEPPVAGFVAPAAPVAAAAPISLGGSSLARAKAKQPHAIERHDSAPAAVNPAVARRLAKKAAEGGLGDVEASAPAPSQPASQPADWFASSSQAAPSPASSGFSFLTSAAPEPSSMFAGLSTPSAFGGDSTQLFAGMVAAPTASMFEGLSSGNSFSSNQAPALLFSGFNGPAAVVSTESTPVASSGSMFTGLSQNSPASGFGFLSPAPAPVSPMAASFTQPEIASKADAISTLFDMDAAVALPAPAAVPEPVIDAPLPSMFGGLSVGSTSAAPAGIAASVPLSVPSWAAPSLQPAPAAATVAAFGPGMPAGVMDPATMQALADQVARNQQQLQELMMQQQSLLQSQMLMMQQGQQQAQMMPAAPTPAPMFSGMTFAPAPAPVMPSFFSQPATGNDANSGAIAGLFE